MDFSSQVPVFLDPPTWHQQEISNQPSSSGLIPSTDPLQIQPPGTNGSGPGSIKPGSMVDRARLAQLPLPEPGLKCPRCESTNTKFCYFNNYNLLQPRHFCKACRRYWTRGGALRNVPVGGGCRRNNKRSKARAKTGSKPDLVSTQNVRRDGINTTTTTTSHSSQVSLLPPQPDTYLPGLHRLNGFGNGFGLNLGVSEQLSSLVGGSGGMGNGLYPFSGSLIPGQANFGFGRVKVDESTHQGLNLSDIGGDYSSWRGGISAWSDISGFHGSSSSSGHLL